MRTSRRSTIPRPLLSLAPVVLGLLLVGCAAPAGEPPEPADSASDASRSERPARTDPAVDPVPTDSGAAAVGEVPAEILSAVLSDAAERSGTPADDIETIRAEAVTWSDGSLDCPEPGQMYTQALVDGYHVVLDAGGEELDYRITESGTFRLCESPTRPGG